MRKKNCFESTKTKMYLNKKITMYGFFFIYIKYTILLSKEITGFDLLITEYLFQIIIIIIIRHLNLNRILSL